MKHLSFISAALLAPLMLSAAERMLDSRLTQVTVFTDRAEVVREAQLDLPAGTHTLIFANLPAQTDTGSLQVNGTGGFTLQDVRFETRQLTELPEGRLKELTVALEAQNTRAKELGFALNRLKERRGALEAVIARLTTPPKESTEPPVMDVSRWADVLNFYNAQLESIDQSQLSHEADLKKVGDEAARLKREIAQLNAQADKISNVAKVVVVLDAPGKITVDLSSIVYGPRWTPSYDIRANTTDKQVSISNYGNITQNTGEAWDNVRLRLSTAQPQIGGREPKLRPWLVDKLQPVAFDESPSVRTRGALVLSPQVNAVQMFETQAGAGGAAKAEAAPAPMRVEQASVQAGATAVVYDIPGIASIPDDNQSVRMAITTQTFPGHFRYSAVPKLSPYVYLKTKVVNTSDYLFLPGPGNIYLDGAFVGKAPMDLVPPGKEFWTWLGIDQGVSVAAKLLERKEGESGIFNKEKEMLFRYEFEIKNNKRQPIELVVWDQLPVSQNESIKVELIKPKYAKDSDSLKMNEHKYLEWFYQLKPGEEVKTPFEFKVTWPQDMQISNL